MFYSCVQLDTFNFTHFARSRAVRPASSLLSSEEPVVGVNDKKKQSFMWNRVKDER